MTEIYVPIDYSDLKSVIPPGEDIIYSSLCQANMSFGPRTEKWNSHILLTKNHFAYTKPVKRKAPESILFPLYKLWLFAPNTIYINKLFSFRLKQDPNYETKENFKKRGKEFGYKFLPYLLEAKQNHLKEMEANPENFSDRKIRKMKSKIYTVEKALQKNTKKFG
jgi:hypothetical protein